MRVTELEPVIRIGLFVASGYLIRDGLPPEIGTYIANDPIVLEVVSQVIGYAVAGLTLIWWQVAKALGRAT